tara:strand:+ start:1013 stop:2332 length:1320 start_codon:yes stop_codon:yes gene_type:complete
MNREKFEEILISKLLNNKDDYYENFNLLKPELFESNAYRIMFSIIDSMYQQGKNIDIISLSDEMKKETGVDCSYDVASIYTLSTWNYDIKNTINELVDLNKSNKLEKVVEDLQEMIRRKEITIEDAIERAISELSKVNDTTVEDVPDIKNQLKDFIEEVEINSQNKGLVGITSGFEEIDMHTNGWKPQDLIIVGGASSMGKTSLALALAHNAALSGVPTTIFSYEMSVNQLVTRLVSSDSYIENKSLSAGQLNHTQWSVMHKSIGRLEKSPLYIDECNNTSLRYLLNRIRRYVLSKGVKLVMIDYLQLVNNYTRGRSREQEVSQIARALKNIAKELNICVIALSQLSRAVEKRQGCRPTLGDLRESGEIEQAADTVVLVYRPEYYGFEADEHGNDVKGLAEIIFAKGRNVGIGNIFLFFNNKFTKFEQKKSLDNFYNHD